MHTNIFDRISFWSLFLVVVLLPIFFLPLVNIPVEMGKGFLLVVGLSVSVVFWAAGRFFDGKVTVPKSWPLAGGALVVLVVLLSALFSGAKEPSLFGTMFDIGTFWYILAAFLLMLMCSIVFRDPKNGKLVLLGTIFSSAVLLVFQSLHIFFPAVLSLGFLGGKTSNLLGSWNALGLFAGFSAIVSLLVVEFFSVTQGLKWILQALTLLSLLLIAAVNFPLVWGLVGVVALIIFIYKVSIISVRSGEEERQMSFPVTSFIIVILALLFFVSGQFIGGLLPSRLGIASNEVGPSLNGTMTVAKSVLKDHPLLGIGPNKFIEAWALYKPTAVNTTIFWDTPFNSGFGLLPTFAATTGILGILSWLLFFALFLTTGFRSVFAVSKKDMNWQLIAFFVLSLYLFVSSFFYFAGSAIFLLAFAFAGVFLGVYSSGREGEEISTSFLNDHRKSFFSISLLVLLIVASAAASFKYTERLVSFSYFNKALASQNVPDAEAAMGKALSLHRSDLYLRTYAQIYLLKLNSLISKGQALTDKDKAELQPSFDRAVNGAELAIVYNPKNYLNYQALGSVYKNAGFLGVKDANGRAVDAYKAAAALNPANPGIKLNIALAYLGDRKLTEAKDYANQALALKADYVDALITLSQIARASGDNATALSYASKALALAPGNKDLAKYVDSLKGGGSTSTNTKDTSQKP